MFSRISFFTFVNVSYQVDNSHSASFFLSLRFDLSSFKLHNDLVLKMSVIFLLSLLFSAFSFSFQLACISTYFHYYLAIFYALISGERTLFSYIFDADDEFLNDSLLEALDYSSCYSFVFTHFVFKGLEFHLGGGSGILITGAC